MGNRDSANWWTGEAGDVFQMDAGQLVPNVTSAKIRLRKPDSTIIEKTAVQQASTRYWGFTAGVGDFDQPGKWGAQLILTRTAGPKISNKTEFEVGETWAVSP
jgi:hypothetical protein